MLKNNIKLDVKLKLIEQELTQTELAEKIGTTGQYVGRVINSHVAIMNKTFIAVMEALGYDIEIHYVKRKD